MKTKMKKNTIMCNRWATMRTAAVSTLLFAVCAAPALAVDLDTFDRAKVVATSFDDPTLGQIIQAAYWRGRTCSTPACNAARPSSIAHVASFGLAAFGGIWIGRRRSD